MYSFYFEYQCFNESFDELAYLDGMKVMKINERVK